MLHQNFQKEVREFQKKYPNSTIGDIQTFALGWKKAVETIENQNNLSLKIISDKLDALKQLQKTEPIYNEDYDKQAYCIKKFEEVLVELNKIFISAFYCFIYRGILAITQED
jgi:hypothetical protein